MRLIIAFLLVSLSACSNIMMDVHDQPGSVEHLMLGAGDRVIVLPPVLVQAEKSNEDALELTSKLQARMVSALEKRGVAAEIGDEKGASYLQISILKYDKGCGLCRGLIDINGVGNSYLNGSVTLVTLEGKRELEVIKRGAESGLSEMGDQTEQNVNYFTESVASKITR